MPRTRSMASNASNPATSSRGKTRKATTVIEDSDDDGESSSVRNIQTYLEKLTDDFSLLKEEIRVLKNRNRELEEEVERSKDQAEATRGSGGRRKADSYEVEELRALVNHLKAENRKKNRALEKMQRRELEREKEDLLDVVPGGEPGDDSIDRMRKILRRFNDLMLVTTLGEAEECPVCFDKLEPKGCSAFACQHLVCNECFKKVLPDKDEQYPCPCCRQKTAREDVELVHMTEQERWDDLLKLAEAWAASDQRPELGTSEEEAQDGFLVRDGETVTSASSETGEIEEEEEEVKDSESEGTGQEQELSSEEASSDALSTTPAEHRPSYFESPSKEKRKRLAELAEERVRKRRNI
ncbi:hypothetical protein CC2G_010226 [Coprinopsis cinerea AmutBmut pab1-1]|nr:hypothetical protein CC2G_010226 [Coprinopsis cinerea AmutBmut pab1-1]